jgi:hypothetical protein
MEARNQYTLGYISHEPFIDGKFRKIDVRVDRPGLDVIAKTGYYPSAQDAQLACERFRNRGRTRICSRPPPGAVRTSSAAWAHAALPPCWSSPPATSSPCSLLWPFAWPSTSPSPAPRISLYAALGGFEGSLALAVFYRALAMGAMGLTAALTGLLTALVPVLFSILHDGLPTPSDRRRAGHGPDRHLAHHPHPTAGGGRRCATPRRPPCCLAPSPASALEPS